MSTEKHLLKILCVLYDWSDRLHIMKINGIVKKNDTSILKLKYVEKYSKIYNGISDISFENVLRL